MLFIEVDAVVVGGGPAGAAAAYHLARRGRSVLVCEKKTFPREKTCGDGLSPRAVRQLGDMGLAPQMTTWQRVEGVRIHAARRSMSIPFSAPRPSGQAAVKTRSELDHIVLANSEAAGATVLYGAEAVRPVFRNGAAEGVVVRRNGQLDEVACSWIVCAEGGATKFAQSLGRSRRTGYPHGFALRQYFPSSAPASPRFDVFLTVRRGSHLIPGYGWAFPVGDGSINAGVGVMFGSEMSRHRNLHSLQRDFVTAIGSRFAIDGEGSRPHAGRLFSGASVWPPDGPGFVLVGDAAGMINPFTGEGIAYAYETGRLAAGHIADALATGTSPTLPGYTDELRDTYGSYYRLGRSFARVMGRPRAAEILVSMAMRSEEVMATVAALLLNLGDDAPWHRRSTIRLLERLADA